MRVVRTFAFVDLCGFTAYTEDEGEEVAVDVLAHLRSTLRASAQRRGVRVTKWLGDGAMVSGPDSSALVECVIEARDAIAQEGPLALRAGIADGKAILFEGDDWVGGVVNVAARLTARAKANQILATQSVADCVCGAVTLRPLQPLRLAGVAAPIEVRELFGVRSRALCKGQFRSNWRGGDAR